MPITRVNTNLINTNPVQIDALNIDCRLGTYFTKSIDSSVTFAVSNVPTDRVYTLTLELTSSAAVTVTWWSGVVWPASVAPTVVSGVMLLTFITDDGGTVWRGQYRSVYSN
jgi:hypothetical protein